MCTLRVEMYPSLCAWHWGCDWFRSFPYQIQTSVLPSHPPHKGWSCLCCPRVSGDGDRLTSSQEEAAVRAQYGGRGAISHSSQSDQNDSTL